MSSSGLIYAVIVGAWAAYLVPMWLRRQDELNEARPTERFSTAIRLLSGRAAMERRYAKDHARSTAEEAEGGNGAPGAVTDSVDVRAFAVSRTGTRTQARLGEEASQAPASEAPAAEAPASEGPSPEAPASEGPAEAGPRPGSREGAAPPRGARPAGRPSPAGRRAKSPEAVARARRSKVLARRRRTTVILFLVFTAGSVVAAVGGLAFLWAPAAPAVLLTAYIAHLRGQERHRFAVRMDRARAEAAARRLRERERHRRTASVERPAERAVTEPEPAADPGLSALAAGRRALVEQTDHAEWVDQQRERQRRPGPGESWEPVPVPLPTYVTAPVAPRATSDLDLSAPDAWSSARSSAVGSEGAAADARRTEQERTGDRRADGDRRAQGLAEPEQSQPGAEATSATAASPAAGQAARRPEQDARDDARRRAASARRSRGRGRTPLFDQFADPDRPRAANE